MLSASTIERAISFRKSRRAAGQPPVRYGVWSFVAVAGLSAAGLLLFFSNLPLQRKVARVVSFYKVSQDESVEKELTRLQAEIRLRSWSAVLQGTDELQRNFGSSLLPSQVGQMQHLRQRALLEQPVQPIYERFLAAAERKDTEESLRLFGQIHPESTYRLLAQPVFLQQSENFAEQRIVRAARLRDEHLCTEAVAELEKVLELMPGHPMARAEQRKECIPPEKAQQAAPPGTAPVMIPNKPTP